MAPGQQFHERRSAIPAIRCVLSDNLRHVHGVRADGAPGITMDNEGVP